MFGYLQMHHYSVVRRGYRLAVMVKDLFIIYIKLVRNWAQLHCYSDVSQIGDNPGRFSPMLKLTDAMHRTPTTV